MIGAIICAIDRKPTQLELLRNGDWIGITSMAIGLGSLVAMLEEGQRKDWFGSELFGAVEFWPRSLSQSSSLSSSLTETVR